MQLYEKIPILRKAKGMTQAELANTIDVSRQSVQKWETGLTCPDIAKLPELALILGVSTDTLLDTTIGRDALLTTAARREADTPSIGTGSVPVLRQRSMLDYLLMVPVALGLALVVGMFYLFGAMFAGILFCISIFTVCGALASIVVIFVNMPNGTGATLMAVSGVFFGLGYAAPFYFLGRLWWQVYSRLAQRLTARLKSIDWRAIIR